MTYIKNLRYITDNFAGEKAVDKIKEETAKELILDALDDEDLGVSIESLGLTLEDINDNKYMYNIDSKDIEGFAKDKIIDLYRYVAYSGSGYGSDNIGKNSRGFCKRVAKRTNTSLMRYQDILRLNGSNPGFGQGGSNLYSIFLYRGGVNCKHIWVKYRFNQTTNKLVDAPRGDKPKKIDKGSVGNA